MSFATANPVNRYPVEPAGYEDKIIDGGGYWPDIDVKVASEVMRVTSSITQVRLVESLTNSLQYIKSLLIAYQAEHEVLDDRAKGLFLRAVYFDAKADLIERYRDYDTTGSADTRSDYTSNIANESRRSSKWAINDLLNKPRLYVEAL